MVVCRGRRIALYNCNDGTLIKHLKGHKDKVYSVSFSYDDKRIASGGADKNTIIWNEEGKGILKFSHSDSIQVVAYNPVEDLLASCSSSDFGFWSPQEKSVAKHKVDAKILCASWRNDGNIIAIGLFSGKVSLYNTRGVEVGTITRNAPVWSLAWNQCSSGEYDGHTLAIGSWDMTLSFYNEFYQPQHEDYYLDYYPSSVSFYGKMSKYIIVGSSSGTLNLFSEEGIFLKTFGKHNGWIWSTGCSSDKQTVACIDSSGMLSCYQFIDSELKFDKWKKIVGYCNTCSNVVIHDFSTNIQRKNLKYKGYVKALGISESQIALVVDREILFYDIASSNDECIFERSFDIDATVEFIKISVNHLIVSMEGILKAYNKTGDIVNQWDLSSNVTCLRHLCGIDEEETLLVGCQDGKIITLVIDSPFYTTMSDLERPITSIDISCDNRYIGIICDDCHLFIFDQIKKAYIQNIKGPKYIVFHDEIEYLYCYGNDGILTVQDIYGLSTLESSKGVAIHFTGTRISCLQKDLSIDLIHVNLLSLAHEKMKNYDFDNAYRIALQGSADTFFKFLAREALINSNFSVSMKCYQKLRMPHMVDYVRRRKLKPPQDCSTPKETKSLISAEIAIMEKRFIDAGDILKKAGTKQILIELFVKIKKFQEAKELLRGDNGAINYIISKEAVWEEQIENWEKASSLYIESKCYFEAVDVVGKFKGEGWAKLLLDLCESIPDEDTKALKRCCHYLSEEDGLHNNVKNILIKIKDYPSLMKLYVKHQMWIEVANLFKAHEHDVDKSLMVPYGDWLASQGDLNGAITIFRKINRQDKNIKLLQALIENAIIEKSFKEVSMLHQTLANEAITLVSETFFL